MVVVVEVVGVGRGCDGSCGCAVGRDGGGGRGGGGRRAVLVGVCRGCGGRAEDRSQTATDTSMA